MARRAKLAEPDKVELNRKACRALRASPLLMGFREVDESFVAYVEKLQADHFLDVTGILDVPTLDAWRGEEKGPEKPEKTGQMRDSQLEIRGTILVATCAPGKLALKPEHLVVPAATLVGWKASQAGTIWPAHLLSKEPVDGQVETLRHTGARWLIVERAVWQWWGKAIVDVMNEITIELSAGGPCWAVFEGARPRLIARAQKPALAKLWRLTGVFPTIAPLQEPDIAARQSMAEWHRYGKMGWAKACPGLRVGSATDARRVALYEEWLRKRESPTSLFWVQGSSNQTRRLVAKGDGKGVGLVVAKRKAKKKSKPAPPPKQKLGPKGPHSKETRLRRIRRKRLLRGEVDFTFC